MGEALIRQRVRHVQAVIAAQSGRLRDGLQAMLDSFLALEIVAVVDDGATALEAIRSWQPNLVILDTQLFDEGTAEFVGAVKQAWKGARCLVVADRLGQFQSILDAGADKVLLKGFSAAELSKALKELLDPAPGWSPPAWV